MSKVDLSDFCKNPTGEKRINIRTLVKIPTGIREVDAFLGGGYPEGGIWVGHTTGITSPENTGKTTFLIKIMIKAAEKDIPSMYLLGEDGDGAVMDKAVHMAGGRYALTTYTDESGKPYTDVHHLCEEKIRLWLSGYLWNLDNSTTDGLDFEDIKKKIIDFSNKLRSSNSSHDEVGLVVLDNLMVLQSSVKGDNDTYSRQSKVCKDLACLAKNLGNLAIVLVAHSRKEQSGSAPENINDNISGSADIKNSLSCIINWKRDSKNCESNYRMVLISKNRVDGSIRIKNPFVVDYDKSTHTLFSKGDVDEQFYKYRWIEEWKRDCSEEEEVMINEMYARVADEKKAAMENSFYGEELDADNGIIEIDEGDEALEEALKKLGADY